MISRSKTIVDTSRLVIPNNPLPRKMPIPNSMKNNKNLIGILFYNFCQKTTVHGVNHLSQVKNQRGRIFWILIVSAAAIGFSVNLFQIVERYLQYQVLSNTYHDYTHFEFPDMSICNLNPIHVPPVDTVEYANLIHLINNFKQIKENRHMASYLLQSLSDYLYIQGEPYSHTGSSLIVSCRYQSKYCTHKHFDRIMLWPYGNCYTFNPFRLNMTRLALKDVIYKGYRPNLEVIIYKGIEFPSEMKRDPHNMIGMPSGVMLMMHEPHSYPYIFEGYLLDFFSVVEIGITRKYHEPRLKSCITERKNFTYIDPITNISKSYIGRWADCLYTMFQHEIVNSCGCYFEIYPILEELKNFKFCKSQYFNKTKNFIYTCLDTAYKKIFANQANMDHCYKDLCEHSSITTVISQAKYPAVEERNSEMVWLRKLVEMEQNELRQYNSSDLSKKALINNKKNLTILQAFQERRKDLLNIDFVNRNFMLLRVVAQSLFMDKVEETEEYPVSRLLSDIGGCVGLWLGASLITIFELFDLILDSADIFCNNPYYRYKNMHRQYLKDQKNMSNALKENHCKTKELVATTTIEKWEDRCGEGGYKNRSLSEDFSQMISQGNDCSFSYNKNNPYNRKFGSNDCSLISSV